MLAKIDTDLIIPNEKYNIFRAGLPHFKSNFSRDSLISGILLKDAVFLKNQLEFSADLQGTKSNSVTGEELGKIFHEYPGVIIRSLSTEFNACDTTALFLIAHEYYQEISEDTDLANRYKTHIENAVKYILAHLDDDIFVESPSFCGAKSFALKVTYWKDSQMPDRELGEPLYPVKYLLAHIQNMAGLRSAAKLLNQTELAQIADRMLEKMHLFFNESSQRFNVICDSLNCLYAQNSDVLSMLFYLQVGDLNDLQLESIKKTAQELTTSIGFRTMEYIKLEPNQDNDGYHTRTVWPFEQALIHIGATRFGLSEVAQIAARILTVLDLNSSDSPEIFEISEDNSFQAAGCNPQLWTIAAKSYFGSIV